MDSHTAALEGNLKSSTKTRVWWGGMLLLCLLHGGILLFNFDRVPPTHGYDWPGHLAYVQYVADHWRAPPPEMTPQFFNPPLYYFSTAIVHRITGIELVRSGQSLNLVLALATVVLLLACARRLWRDDLLPALWFIGFYVLNPTVYRTFGMVRPEAMLIPLFAAAVWLVVTEHAAGPERNKFAVVSGCLAGLAFGTRQWGLFLEIAFIIWLLLSFWRSRSVERHLWAMWRCIGLQVGSFLVLAVLFLIIRGGSPLAFNASPLWPERAFLTRLDLPALFSYPVRPALDYRLWPVLYADYWGDYWRYWREALIHDPMPTSARTVASMVRSMWAALPASLLAVAGFLISGTRLVGSDHSGARSRLHQLARVLTVVSLLGFVSFAALYAQPGKGDTVKSVYVVYLIPFWGWLSSIVAYAIVQALPRSRLGLYLALALLAVFVVPNGAFLPADQMIERSWELPPVQCPVIVAFGEAITLVGYDLEAESPGLTVTLFWKTASYVGVGYKVFVHLSDADGELLAQSDGVPAGWRRSTQSWIPGEFISDAHMIPVLHATLSDAKFVNVGLYDESGRRLTTMTGSDHFAIELGDIAAGTCGE